MEIDLQLGTGDLRESQKLDSMRRKIWYEILALPRSSNPESQSSFFFKDKLTRSRHMRDERVA